MEDRDKAFHMSIYLSIYLSLGGDDVCIPSLQGIYHTIRWFGQTNSFGPITRSNRGDRFFAEVVAFIDAEVEREIRAAVRYCCCSSHRQISGG